MNLCSSAKQLLAFRPNKLDWIFADENLFAGMLSLYVAFSLMLAYPIWAIGTGFVITNPYAGITSSKSLYRVLGTLLRAIVSIAVTPNLINTPELFTLFLPPHGRVLSDIFHCSIGRRVAIFLCWRAIPRGSLFATTLLKINIETTSPCLIWRLVAVLKSRWEYCVVQW